MNLIENNRQIPRMRTVKEAAAEIKQLDAHSALTEWRIRELALSGVLPRVQAKSCLLTSTHFLSICKTRPPRSFSARRQRRTPPCRVSGRYIKAVRA